ncbi:MAG: endonuclease/exonuclease/phosphatase family protein [Burkholderiales bacterium]
MNLITWNIQWGRGVDGNVDLQRIVRAARQMADFDVLCLQEVAVNFPGLPGSRGEDQVKEFSRLLPGFSAHFGAATDLADDKGVRRQFGNLILSRLPVLQVFRHLLPWPAAPDVKSMQRIALEVILQASFGPLRVVTTHLEYYSLEQRMAQVKALRSLHAEACSHARWHGISGNQGEPFERMPRPACAILTGDFNFQPESAEYQRLTARFTDDVPSWVDAWIFNHPGQPHAPTAGVHENSWAKTPYCCDFVYVTEDLAPSVRTVTVDHATQASDHQPVMLRIDDPPQFRTPHDRQTQ